MLRFSATRPLAVVCASFACLPHAAFAAHGYIQYGYGAASKSMAGVSYALPQDSLIPSSNPAGLVEIGSRFDLGVDYLAPRREAEISGNRLVTLASADGAWDANEIGQFYVPEFGIAQKLNPRFSYGLAVYGNGGLNTEYSTNPYGGFGATGHAGTDLMQVFVTPAIAFRITERQSVGLAVNLAYQQMKVYGLDVFATESFPGPFSESPGNVTTRGYDRSTGIGYRLGYLAEPIEGLRIGASWQPRTSMSRLDKYKGLIRDQGKLDVPAKYGAGISYQSDGGLTLAFDVEHIAYSKVPAIGTPLQPLLDGALLGADDGPGFGWRSMTSYKLGASYELTPQWRIAAGFGTGRQPIPRDQTLFNIITPAILEDRYTAGIVYRLDALSISGYYMYGPSNTVRGKNSIPPNQLAHPLPPTSFGGGEADLRAEGQCLGIAFGYQF